jgi:hypothetical protein
VLRFSSKNSSEENFPKRKNFWLSSLNKNSKLDLSHANVLFEMKTISDTPEIA